MKADKCPYCGCGLTDYRCGDWLCCGCGRSYSAQELEAIYRKYEEFLKNYSLDPEDKSYDI